MTFDYAGYQRDLERLLERVNACEGICKANNKIILKYYHLLTAKGYKPATLRNNVEKLLSLAKMLNKPFEDADKDDIIELVSKVQNKYSSEWNILSYKGMLKKFYRWLRGLDDERTYPLEVRWITLSEKKTKRKKRKDVLTKEEIERIAKEAKFKLRNSEMIEKPMEEGINLKKEEDIAMCP